MPQEISSLTRSPRLICIGIDLIRMHCSAAGGVCALSRLKAQAKRDADAQGSALSTSASRNERKLCR
jgi:hypothetical protein